jgi:hypothetical protein
MEERLAANLASASLDLIDSMELAEGVEPPTL